MNGKPESANAFKLTRIQDEASPVQGLDYLDAGPMAGRWINTNRSSKGMIEVTIATTGNTVKVHVIGAGADGPIDWGWVDGDLFGCIEEDGLPGIVISSCYNFGFMKSQMQIRLNRGVLVIAAFNEFSDDSGRSNYFTREFFHS